MNPESAARVGRLQAAAADAGLDALLLTDAANVRYATGGYAADVLWSSPTRIVAAVIPRDGEPVLLVPGFIAAEAGSISGWIHVETYDSLVEAPVAQLATLLAEARHIGIEQGGESRLGTSLATVEALRDAVTGTVEDAMPVIARVRAVKSAWEIDRLRWACAANEAGFAAAFDRPRAGQTEVEVARDIVAGGLAAGAGWPAWTMPGWIGMTSGAGSYGRFVEAPRHRRLELGDLVWADVGFRVDGYWSDHCRAGVIGGPTARQVDRQRRIVAATTAGVRAARPGATAADVARAIGAALEHEGLPGLGFGRLGHGIGLTATEMPSIALHDATVLEAGMVITVEPAAVLDDGLYCAEQIVVVAEEPELLSLASTDLATI